MTDNFTVHESSSIIEAMEAIDKGGAGICCVVDAAGILTGVLTDGDLRRALISGASLQSSISNYIEPSPKVVTAGTSRAHTLDLMKALNITAVPEVDAESRVLAVHTMTKIVGTELLPNRAVIMAGGKGTRLGDLTKYVPKPLMTIAGRPIIEWVILQLVGAGIREISVSVNHFADQIETQLGRGEQLGCSIEYLREEPENPLGTAGSLTLLDKMHIDDGAPPLVVVNADIMADFDVFSLLQHHNRSKASMTMGVKLYQHKVPFGVVEIDENGAVSAITEKPDIRVMINSAIYCINAPLVRRLPYNKPSTMPELAQICLDSGQTVQAWNIESDWIDIGTPDDLARAKGTLL